MRALIQRVKSASVTVDGSVIGQIEQGLLVLFGMQKEDHAGLLPWFVEKLVHLRIFKDDAGKMNRSIQDVDGGILVVSQFTLYGDCRTGRRPSFIQTLSPDQAKPLYDQFVVELRKKMGDAKVQTGEFGAEMQVELINDGPVTFLLEQT
ncbi:D-aminoacyl-tRNA deacylase [Simkania negevensis]|uniref:D-aminoacyl-tRNA deacylase n=1 Tax=Simkania negevensis (strain ATCC VR-1471 / DSM 27360 / Z) TaxID=331113 RepID=F8L5N2_SIMNZ|nr:D-aminoacyl-tRNA deacylase [Simkania negevensis]CCB89831.1 D-tyrosyl-tRNA(Tyr) deacylase [Simkania negevensis Z]